MELIGVVFTRNFDIYNGGEMAGFPPDRAAELVAIGVAAYDQRTRVMPEPQPTAIDLLEAEEAAGNANAKKTRK